MPSSITRFEFARTVLVEPERRVGLDAGREVERGDSVHTLMQRALNDSWRPAVAGFPLRA